MAAARGSRDWRRLSAFGATFAVGGLFLIDVCDAVFGCGCRPLWAGADIACNVHHAAPPHCPWCVHPGWGGAAAVTAVAAAQAAAVFAPLRLGLASRIFLALAAVPLVGGGVAALQGLIFGYWS